MNGANDYEVSFLVKDKVGDLNEHNIEDYKNTCFYDFLKCVKKEFETTPLDNDIKCLLSFFNLHRATNYIDIYEHCECEMARVMICEESKIYAEIRTFELSVDLILNKLLGLKSLDELNEESFGWGLNRYVQKSLLKKIHFLKSINATRELNQYTECIHISRINKQRIFNIYLESLKDTNIQLRNDDGMKIAYIRGSVSKNKSKGISFFEDDYENKMLLIVKIDDNYHSSKEIRKIFEFEHMIEIGKVILGITDAELIPNQFKIS